MTILQSIVLGALEGITEFLPISSTGHLILAGELMRISKSAYFKSFEITIQLGAILAVVALYWRSLLDVGTLKKLAAAFIPTGIIGLIFYKAVKTYLLGNESVVLWALFLGGAALILFEKIYKNILDKKAAGIVSGSQVEETSAPRSASDFSNISYKDALLLGCFQSIAIVPGVSRSAATILGGLALGMRRRQIVEFSFLLAVPTMLSASGLDLFKSSGLFSRDEVATLALGFIVSFAVALLSIKFLLRYIKNHDFTYFGVYRIIIAILFWTLIT